LTWVISYFTFYSQIGSIGYKFYIILKGTVSILVPKKKKKENQHFGDGQAEESSDDNDQFDF
jgi:hypothetical protein